MYWYLVFVAFTLLFTRAPATFSVNITDGEHLKEYLCSSERTIAPYTHLVIKHPRSSIMWLNNTGIICLVENTTNIYISAWQDDNVAYQKPLIVYCKYDGSGFSFFNVTNLTMTSVQFRQCGWWEIPTAATKYINGSDQFLYYGDAQTTFLFNHCNNLTLYNVLGDHPSVGNISIIGVNLCGWNNITAVIPEKDLPTTPLSTMLIYYTDSAIMSSNSECNLHIESNILSGQKYIDIEQDLVNSIERMPVLPIRDFAVYIAQQDFKANVDITVHPMLYYYNADSNYFDCQGDCSLNAIIMFVNSVTDSHVTFQGYPYKFCTDKVPYHPSYQFYRSMQLEVVFYETPSFNGSAVRDRLMPLSIQNTSFAFYIGNPVDYYGNHILRVLDFSRSLSYQVAIENVAWCNNSIFSISTPKWFHLLYAQSFFQARDQALHLKMDSVYAQHNTYGGADPLRQRNSGSLVQFVNVACTLSGDSYFGQNCGGSVLGIVSSNLTITGNLTVCDGYAYKGGGIRLDSYSYLFLKEPLDARFINNSAQQGSGIFAPVHMSSTINRKTIGAIQIVPNTIYSQDNLSNISIKLHFNKTGLESSLYAPDFNFLGQQISPYFFFNSSTWDSGKSWYTYTTLIDTIFVGNDVDKYTSLSNGVCIGFRGKKVNCSYVDVFYHNRDPTCGGYGRPSVEIYPGMTALSLICADNKQYQFTYYYQGGIEDGEYAIRQISCETKDYGLWKTSLSQNNMSVTFPFPHSQYILPSYCLFLRNAENSRSIPFLHVEVRNECPIGFSINLTAGGVCKCSKVLRDHAFKCDLDTLSFSGPENYWIGLSYSENGEGDHTLTEILLSTHCPPNYCKNVTTTHFKIYLNDSLSDTVCLHNRSGILCGQCSNYSAVFGSDACYSDCSDLYLLTLPAYALAGFLLVVVLFALRLTVATGTINGVIFYANILDLSMGIFSHENTKFDVMPLRVIISLLNLNLGFPVCFYEGMTPTSKTGFQFVFPVYLWGIVLSLIFASRFSLRLSNVISRSSVQVLATLFYLCFSKIILTTIYIISVSTVFSLQGDLNGGTYSSNVTFTVWYYGGTGYGQGLHGFLIFVAAVFIALFLLPYTVLLTFAYYFARFKIINKFRPFLDAYGGPFRDGWRFWFGLRLWLTALLLSINGALQGSDARKMLLAHFVIMLVFILLQAHVHPFHNQLVGALDIFFMLNYFLIVVFYLLTSQSTFLEAYIYLVSSAIFVMVMIILSHFFYNWIYLKKQAVFLDWKIKVSNKLRKYMVVENEENEEDSDDDLFHAAEERDHVADTY